MTVETDAPITSWDTAANLRSRAEAFKEGFDSDPEDHPEIPESMRDYREEHGEQIVTISLDNAFTHVADDPLADEDDWEFFLNDFDTILDEHFKDVTSWHCEVNNFGWRKLNGVKDFEAESAEDILREMLPDTECTFKVYLREEDGKKYLAVNNAHHDSMFWEEWYYLYPAS